MNWIWSVCISVTYSVACIGLGLAILSAWCRYINKNSFDLSSPVDFSAGLATCFLIGVAASSAILIFLSLMGQLRSFNILLILFVGICGLINSKNYIRIFFDTWRTTVLRSKPMPYWLSMILFFSVLLGFALAVGSWILPPRGDAAAFYFVYPKVIAATGLLKPIPGPFYFFSEVGLPLELHFAALISLADDHAAKLFVFPIAISVGIFLASIVRLCGGEVVAVIVGWAMLLSSYTFYNYIYDGKVDLAAAAFGLASVYWVLIGSKSNLTFSPFVLAGWLAGLATVAKFSYLLVLGINLTLIIYWQFIVGRNSDISLGSAVMNVAKVGVILILLAIVAWIPQLVKNELLFSQPLAPFIGGQFDKGNWINQAWFSEKDTQKILMTYPLALVFGRYPGQGGGLSFLFIAFLPFLFLMKRPVVWKKSMTVAVTISALIAVIAWMALRPSIIAPRYILVSLLLFVPIFSISVEYVLIHKIPFRLLQIGTTLTISLAIASSFWHLLPIPNSIISRITSRTNACLLASMECEVFSKLAEIALPNERIFIASYYPYWLTPSQLQCRDTLEEQNELPDRSQLINWLQSHGFSYVAVDPLVFTRLATDLQKLSMNKDHLVYEIPVEKDLKLYRINTVQIPIFKCEESNSGRWYLKKYSKN